MDKMISGEGQFYDFGSDIWYYYYFFINFDWFVIFCVDNVILVNLICYEINLVIGGFIFVVIIIILFGFYLCYVFCIVLMNIINVIKIGDVKCVLCFEVMLSKVIEINKQCELFYVCQVIIDVFIGCKNCCVFDSDIVVLMNDYQLFVFVLVDIDNFKLINDIWGYFNGDIVLCNVVCEGLQVFQLLEIFFYCYGGEEFVVVFFVEYIDNVCMLLEIWWVNVE